MDERHSTDGHSNGEANKTNRKGEKESEVVSAKFAKADVPAVA